MHTGQPVFGELHDRVLGVVVADVVKPRGSQAALAFGVDDVKTEQDRMSKRLVFLEAQIEAGATEHEPAQAHLDDCLTLAKDCHAI